jgi:hypothetical protein
MTALSQQRLNGECPSIGCIASIDDADRVQIQGGISKRCEDLP